VTAIIPSKNCRNLSACVVALRYCEPGIGIIVVDDGAACLPDGVTVVKGVKPFIFARNINLGIVAAGADDVVLLNDDALLKTPGGFTEMTRQLDARRDYGIVAAACNNVGNLNQNYRGIGWRDEPRMACFTCVLIPRRTIDVVGLLDERFVGYGFDDDDYCLRVRQAGLKIGVFDGCVVDHASLTPTFRSAAHAGGQLEQNRKIYKDKWVNV